MSVDRRSPSGPVASIKGLLAIAATLAPLTTVSTATGTMAGALTGDTVSLSPRANLTAAVSIAWARVVAADTIAIGFQNSAASTQQAAVTFDAVVQRR